MESIQSAVVKPAAVKITAEQALATIREVKIAMDGVLQVVGGLVRSMNGLLIPHLAKYWPWLCHRLPLPKLKVN